MSRNRQGFTAVELLIVILIIVVLMGLVIIGISMYTSRAKQKETRVILQNLAAVMKERAEDVQRVPNTSTPQPPLANPGSVITNASGRTGAQVVQTRSILARLRAVPANKIAIENLPAERRMVLSGSSDPVVLDAWNNPIIYVPADGLAGVAPRTGAAATIVKAPGDRAFWASAGPDGNFTTGDDNIYSFEN